MPMKTIYNECLKYALLFTSAGSVITMFCNDTESFCYFIFATVAICIIGIVVGE